MGAERLFVPRHQVKLASGGRFVAVITHVTAGPIYAIDTAGKTVASQQALVTVVAGKGRESALGADGISEQFVRPPMVAQRPALDSARYNDICDVGDIDLLLECLSSITLGNSFSVKFFSMYRDTRYPLLI